MAKEIQRFSLPSGELDGVIDVGEGVNAVGVNAMADRLAVGCDSGLTKVYAMVDDAFESPEPVYTCEGHAKPVCACGFSPRGGRLLTSAKDGTACAWKDGTLLSNFTCSVEDPKALLLVLGAALGTALELALGAALGLVLGVFVAFVLL